MVLVPTRNFDSAAEMMKFYQANRRAMMPPPKPIYFRPVVAVEPVPAPEPEPAPPAPPAAPLPPPYKVSTGITYRVIPKIIKAACEVFDLPASILLSNRRVMPIPQARQIAMALAYRITKKSFPHLGRIFNRDHTTVLHAVRKLRPVLLEVDAGVDYEIVTLHQIIELCRRTMDGDIGTAQAYMFKKCRLRSVNRQDAIPFDAAAAQA